MGPNNKRRVPKGPTAQPKARGQKASGVKLAKAQGITPGKTAYGILHGGNNSVQKLRAKTSRMFGNGSRNTPNGQARLSSKAKRQVQ